MKIRPVEIDGIMWVLIGTCPFIVEAFHSKVAEELFTKKSLFFVILIFGSLNTACTALKAYRSTQYANHVADQNGNGHVETVNVPVKIPVTQATLTVQTQQQQQTEEGKKSL